MDLLSDKDRPLKKKEQRSVNVCVALMDDKSRLMTGVIQKRQKMNKNSNYRNG